MKTIKLTTPRGVAYYPSLKRPDTQYHDHGIYKADVLVKREAAAPLMDQLAKIYKEATGKAPNMTDNTMFTVQTSKDTGEETGMVLFKIRVKNRMTKSGDLWDRRPKIFDSSLAPVDVDPKGGSEMKVSFEPYVWESSGKKGVSLQVAAVMVLKMVESTSDNAGDYGFEKEEGFVADDDVQGFIDETVEDEDNGDF